MKYSLMNLCHSQNRLVIMIFEILVWDWGLILGIKIKILDFEDWEFGTRIGY